MYQRRDVQVQVLHGRMQIVIADNELPSVYKGSYAEMHFSYPSPTVSTISHPGRDRVRPIHAEESETP